MSEMKETLIKTEINLLEGETPAHPCHSVSDKRSPRMSPECDWRVCCWLGTRRTDRGRAQLTMNSSCPSLCCQSLWGCCKSHGIRVWGSSYESQSTDRTCIYMCYRNQLIFWENWILWYLSVPWGSDSPWFCTLANIIWMSYCSFGITRLLLNAIDSDTWKQQEKHKDPHFQVRALLELH